MRHGMTTHGHGKKESRVKSTCLHRATYSKKREMHFYKKMDLQEIPEMFMQFNNHTSTRTYLCYFRMILLYVFVIFQFLFFVDDLF